ncbi:MAG: hypothetical protein ACQEVA_17300 [Myxococcota bacterium]
MGDKTDIFLRPVFRGERFEEHDVPVEVLEEFRRYQALLIDLAKAIFYEQHPERKRVPRGFVDRFGLALGDVEEGSAAPVLRRIAPDDEQMQPQLIPEGDEFEQARDRLNRFLQSRAEDSGEVDLPIEVLSHFKYFGRTLRDDESIELARDASSSGPRLDKTVRQQVLKTLGEPYEETVELVGYVSEADPSRHSFEIQAHEQGLVEVVLQSEHERDVLDALRQYRALEVRLEGNAVFSPDGELKKITSVDDILLQDRGPELEQRFDELHEIEDGWYHGQGFAPREDIMDAVLDFVREAAYEHNAYLPFVYPTPEGGLQLEWELDDWDVEIEVEPDGAVLVMAENRTDQTWDEWAAHISDEKLAARIARFIIERDSAD